MLEAIKILAEQLETEDTERWRGLILNVFTPRPDGVGSIFTEEEIEYLRQAVIKRERKEFNAAVLRRLSRSDLEEFEEAHRYAPKSYDLSFQTAAVKAEGQAIKPQKLIVNRAQLELMQRLAK